jgi:hypothetical protein
MTHSSQDRTVLGALYLLAPARASPRYRNPRRRQAGAHPTDSRLTPLRILLLPLPQTRRRVPVAGVVLEANRP